MIKVNSINAIEEFQSIFTFISLICWIMIYTEKIIQFCYRLYRFWLLFFFFMIPEVKIEFSSSLFFE